MQHERDGGQPAEAVSPHERPGHPQDDRSEEHTSELQSRQYLVCRLLLEKNKMLPQLVVDHRSDVQRSALLSLLLLDHVLVVLLSYYLDWRLTLLLAQRSKVGNSLPYHRV